MGDFKKLLVWQRSHSLCIRVEQVAGPIARRKPDLAKQLIRAADSVPAAIAEGRGRSTDKDFAHYVSIAIGSVTEVENHVQRAFDGGLISTSEHEALTADVIAVRRMLIGLQRTLRGQPRKPHEERA